MMSVNFANICNWGTPAMKSMAASGMRDLPVPKRGRGGHAG